MTVDLDAARAFLASHGRLLDRLRLEAVLGTATDGGDALLAALDGYRNDDGGYGWGLEPDLRSRTSQPAPALHAFEVLEDIAPRTSPRALQLCDWLERVSLPDGGLPFAFAVPDPAGCAPFWTSADPGRTSLQITAIVAAMAHRVARHDPAVAAHPWLARASACCLDAIERLPGDAHAMVVAFSMQLLDVLPEPDHRAAGLLARLGERIPADGHLHVAGGLDDEFMRPLDFAPDPAGPARRHLDPAAIAADLDRHEHGQQPDGGWEPGFASYSPAATLEWRGHATVRAIALLRRHGRA